MDRLTNKQGDIKACVGCSDDDCYTCISIIRAIDRLRHYEDLESQLQEVYGECDGILEQSVKCLVEHEETDIGKLIKSRLLTDDTADKWQRWKDLDEKGRLFEKPCNIGDTLYEPRTDRGIISEYTVRSITDFGSDVFIGWRLNSGIYSTLDGVSSREIGKSVFLKEEEAKKALEEMNNEK